MSSVKNDNPLANLWNTVVTETGRAAGEAGRLMTESINDIGRATQSGGVVGGTLQAFEEVSPGNFAAGAVDVLTGPGQLNPQLAAGIRGTVNFATSLIPGVAPMAAPLQLQALKDAATAFGLLGGTPQAGGPDAQRAPGATRTQTPERPTEAAGRKTGREALDAAKERKQEAKAEARRELIAAIKEKAVDRMKEKAQNDRIAGLEERVSYLEQLAGVDETKPNGGYGPPSDLTGGMITIDFGVTRPGKNGDPRLAKLEQDLAKADADIDKILSNPNLSFEDMIFMLMNAIIKQSQSEVKLGLADEKAARDVAKGGRDIERNAIKAEGSSIASEQVTIAKMAPGKEKDEATAALNVRKTNLDSRSESLSTNLGDATESRTERFEELKNAMNKITEMQQALSNILNNMHQTAMSTIGNIR